ncbi:hypothetical protein OJF2_03910 [Aquisphaera giovannonii]|uniref:Uncharacterized protein n=1 Tax=Aquisphaera giovannonii TaxID=406548 RepID=A0A5B9VV07_9BACT|nr:hypothetical protein [Aquisphaera giovannonii]QEH31924.1 hypothetical protein OJF2_03910 [Aquisphaera giovannonii]
MSHLTQTLTTLGRKLDRPRGPVGWLYTNNPFYVLSADLVFIGLRMSFDTSGRTIGTGALMIALLGYTLLLATTACLLIRVGRVWDDARTLLLLVVAMFLAISVTFDEALAGNPRLGRACFLGGLLFAILVGEGLLRGIRLRLGPLYHAPYLLILCLFFLYPLALTPFLRDPEGPALRWLLFGFSPLASLAFLSLIPAIRRGRGYVAKNGSPWPYPLFPWTLFGLLAAAVCGRAAYLCTSFHFVEMSRSVGRSDSIFGPYFLVPFLLALDVLLVEAAIASRSRPMQRLAMAVLPGVLVLAMAGHRPDPVFRGFLDLFRKGLGGSPLYLSLVAVTGLYAHAASRRVPLGLAGLTSSLLALAVVGPDTYHLNGLVAPRPFPLLAVAILELGLAVRRRESWRSVVGSACLVATITIGLDRLGLGHHRGLAAFHLAVIAAIGIGACFRDRLGRFLQHLAAACLGLSCLVAIRGGPGLGDGVPEDLLRAYPLLVIVASALLGYGIRCPSFLAVALVGLTGWLAGAGWRTYRDLRRIVVGLDWIASGLIFFALAAAISLLKTGLPAKWADGRRADPLRTGAEAEAPGPTG